MLRKLSALALTAALALASPAEAQTIVATEYGVAVDSTVSNIIPLRRALDAAGYQRRPGQVAVVQLPCGVIGYTGQASIPDSVLVRGCGGGDIAAATDAEGRPYTYVRPVAWDGRPETRLKVLDSSMLDDNGQPVVTRFGVRPGTTWMGVQDLVLDGNWAGNLADYRAIPEDQVKPFLQDGNGAAAFALDGSAGRPECRGTPDPHGPGGRVTLHLRGVVITGYAANGIVGTTCMWYDGERVSLGRALHNHTFYGGNGVFRDLTLDGWAWTNMVVMADLDVTNLTIRITEPNPSGRWNPEVVNVRQGRFTARGVHAVTDGEGQLPLQLVRVDYGVVDVDTFVWHARTGSVLGQPGDGGAWRHGRIHGALESLIGGYYLGSPPADGVAHTYLQDIVVDGPVTDLLADRGQSPARVCLDGVTARRMFVVASLQEGSALAITNSTLSLDPAMEPHTSGHTAIVAGRYVTPASICIDAATAGTLPAQRPAAATCAAVLAAAVPAPPEPTPAPQTEPPSLRYQWRTYEARRCVDTETGRLARAALCPPEGG